MLAISAHRLTTQHNSKGEMVDTILLYAAHKPLTERHEPVPVNGVGIEIYIRAELHRATDLVEALGEAEPMDGEIVLNSIPASVA